MRGTMDDINSYIGQNTEGVDEDAHLPCVFCGSDITREQQRSDGMRYIGGDTCAYVHRSCAERKVAPITQ